MPIAEAVKARCAAAGVNVSTSSPASTLLDATARSLPTVVRASPHYYNTEAEIERVLDVRGHGPLSLVRRRRPLA